MAKTKQKMNDLENQMKKMVVSRKYHKEKKKCPICSRVVNKYHMRRHQKSEFCLTYQKIMREIGT